MSEDEAASEAPPMKRGLLDRIERLVDRLPHPMSLFIIGALAVLALSQIADAFNWSVELVAMKPDADGKMVETTETIEANGLLAGDGASYGMGLSSTSSAIASLGRPCWSVERVCITPSTAESSRRTCSPIACRPSRSGP